MKLHIVTIGSPKLDYAKLGWAEYLGRLKHYHSVKTTHIADKNNNTKAIMDAAGQSYKIVMEIEGKQPSSPELAQFLNKRALEGREVSLIIGGPNGLPQEVINASDYKWSLGKQTLPHDLAMITTLEALYRASTINANTPYHK